MATVDIVCIICEKDEKTDTLIKVKQKGFDKLVEVSKQRKREDTHRFLYLRSFKL